MLQLLEEAERMDWFWVCITQGEPNEFLGLRAYGFRVSLNPEAQKLNATLS